MALLRDTPAALRMLDKSVSGGFFCYPYLQRDPLLEPIRAKPDFMPLLAKARTRYEAFKAQFAPDPPAPVAIREL